jgi:cobalt/nickel transport system permease protein
MNTFAAWEGVDKKVEEKVTAETGHPPQEPVLNTDQGDLLLFLFLLAGAIGGFIVGYTFRGLFPPRAQGVKTPSSQQEIDSHASP